MLYAILIYNNNNLDNEETISRVLTIDNKTKLYVNLRALLQDISLHHHMFLLKKKRLTNIQITLIANKTGILRILHL